MILVLSLGYYQIPGKSALRFEGYSLKFSLYHWWCPLALGSRLARVQNRKVKAGRLHAMMAKPVHCTISPNKLGQEMNLKRKPCGIR